MRGGATPSASLLMVKGETDKGSHHGDRNRLEHLHGRPSPSQRGQVLPQVGTVSGPIRATRQMVVRYRMARVKMQPKSSEQTQRQRHKRLRNLANQLFMANRDTGSL